MTSRHSLWKVIQPLLPPSTRTLYKLPAIHASRELVDRPDLFNYTSGRWLFVSLKSNICDANLLCDRYNEPLRLKERILHFNVIELNQAAAAAVGKDVASVQSFRKLAEGGFNRTFELIIDGLEVIARLPYPSTYPKYL